MDWSILNNTEITPLQIQNVVKSRCDLSYKARLSLFEDEVVITRKNVEATSTLYGYDVGYDEHLVFDRSEFKAAMKELMED